MVYKVEERQCSGTRGETVGSHCTRLMAWLFSEEVADAVTTAHHRPGPAVADGLSVCCCCCGLVPLGETVWQYFFFHPLVQQTHGLHAELSQRVLVFPGGLGLFITISLIFSRNYSILVH